jgi:hypothetical protein
MFALPTLKAVDVKPSENCDENGAGGYVARLLVSHVSIQILVPCGRPILIATKHMLLRGRTLDLQRRSNAGFQFFRTHRHGALFKMRAKNSPMPTWNVVDFEAAFP